MGALPSFFFKTQMKNFSERLGITPSDEAIQVDSINDALLNSVWNQLHLMFDERGADYWISFARWIALNYRKTPIDEVPDRNFRCKDWVKGYLFSMQWFDVYNFLEFVVENSSTIPLRAFSTSRLSVIFNSIFEREKSGYRFISGKLAPISGKEEVEEIKTAINLSSTHNLFGTYNHLKTAVDLFSKKPDPDFRNSIKESICAIESISKVLSKSESQGLLGALEALSQKMEIHGALKAGFIKLYGYTSDENGIRHAILDEPNIGFDDAKYMLISCSAFVNYLISKASKSSLL